MGFKSTLMQSKEYHIFLFTRYYGFVSVETFKFSYAPGETCQTEAKRPIWRWLFEGKIKLKALIYSSALKQFIWYPQEERRLYIGRLWGKKWLKEKCDFCNGKSSWYKR